MNVYILNILVNIFFDKIEIYNYYNLCNSTFLSLL